MYSRISSLILCIETKWEKKRNHNAYTGTINIENRMDSEVGYNNYSQIHKRGLRSTT